MTRLIVTFLTLFLITTTAYAGWVGPETVVSGKWGKGDLEFGFNKGDYEDDFPKVFSVFPDGKVLVKDTWNGSLKAFDKDGRFIKSIRPPGEGLVAFTTNVFVSSNYFEFGRARGVGLFDFIEECWIWKDDNEDIGLHGKAHLDLASIHIDANKNIYIWNNIDSGWKYSNDGTLLKSYERPPPVFIERLDWKRLSGSKYLSTIKVNDEHLEWTGSQPFSNYSHSANGNIYAYGRVVKGKNETPFTRLVKITHCGEVEASLNLPTGLDYEFDQPPTITPEGHVYFWKRENNTYNILKWSWVDEPSDRKSDCLN